MILYGTTHRVGDSIAASQISDPALADLGDPAVLAAACLAAVDPALAERAAPGDLLLAGTDFGGGAGAEQAVLALQALGIAAIICAVAAPSFVAVAHSYGLPVLISPAASAALGPGQSLRIDLARGSITERGSGASYAIPPSPAALLDLLRRAQLYSHTRRVVEQEGFDG